MVIERDDSLELIKKVLKMTPDERKRLGINKSTLWYMRKNIEKGKKIKVYDKNILKKVNKISYPGLDTNLASREG